MPCCRVGLKLGTHRVSCHHSFQNGMSMQGSRCPPAARTWQRAGSGTTQRTAPRRLNPAVRRAGRVLLC